jgi:thiamine pyrophosphokinase
MPSLVARYEHVARQTHPPAKDTTDGELAIAEAVARGAGEIFLVGGLGGQMDHAFAHLMLLLRSHGRGLKIMMTSGHEEAWPLIDETVALELARGTRLSVLPVSDLIGLSIAGVRWPLDAATLHWVHVDAVQRGERRRGVRLACPGHGCRAGLPACGAGLRLQAAALRQQL